MKRALAALILAGAALAPARAAIGAEPSWRYEQPTPPGADAPGPLGAVTALTMLAPNRGLMQAEGGGGSPKGLWTFDGERWTVLASVCGAARESGGIVVAGRDELWTIADPAPGASTPPPNAGPDTGTTLCHFRGGQVVGSYAVGLDEPGRYFPMHAGVCVSPDDCWFGGDAGRSTDGSRGGAFHLHWDGQKLVQAYGRQYRAVTALVRQGGDLLETVAQGARPLYRATFPPLDPEPVPQLLHVLHGTSWDNTGVAIESRPTGYIPAGADARDIANYEQLDLADAATAADGELWLAGGPARSGPWWGVGYGGGYPPSKSTYRLPVAAVRAPGGAVTQLRFSDADAANLASPFQGRTFTSVAPIPGRPHEAWLTLEPNLEFDSVKTNQELAPVILVRVRFDPGAAPAAVNASVLEQVTPAGSGQKGAARHVACTGPSDCWAATTQGWILHWTDGSRPARDQDPAYERVISLRPPDGRSPKPLPDSDAVDDSQRFKPAAEVIVVEPPAPAPPPPAAARRRRLGALVLHARTRAVGQRRLELRFELARPARIGVAGELHGRVVARAAARLLVPGDQRVELAVDPRRRPTRLRFLTRELAPEASVLRTSATRGGATLLVRAGAPVAGRLRVRAVAAGTTPATRTATLRAGATAAIRLALPPALRKRELLVRFDFTPAAGGAKLAAQRIVAASRSGAR